MKQVAPIVGAWIEIQTNRKRTNKSNVAPIVGAWIEISGMVSDTESAIVAPIVGAWIEIALMDMYIQVEQSLLSWERGLKYIIISLCHAVGKVAPIVGAWIEISYLFS